MVLRDRFKTGYPDEKLMLSSIIYNPEMRRNRGGGRKKNTYLNTMSEQNMQLRANQSKQSTAEQSIVAVLQCTVLYSSAPQCTLLICTLTELSHAALS